MRDAAGFSPSLLHTAQRAQKKGQTAPDDAANPTVPAHAQREKTSDGSSTTMVFYFSQFQGLNCTSRSNDLASACREVDRPQPVDRGKPSLFGTWCLIFTRGPGQKKAGPGGEGERRSEDCRETSDVG
jgi:hypothetical protein